MVHDPAAYNLECATDCRQRPLPSYNNILEHTCKIWRHIHFDDLQTPFEVLLELSSPYSVENICLAYIQFIHIK